MIVSYLDLVLSTFCLFPSPQAMFSLPTFVAGVTWRSAVTKRPLPICTVHQVRHTCTHATYALFLFCTHYVSHQEARCLEVYEGLILCRHAGPEVGHFPMVTKPSFIATHEQSKCTQTTFYCRSRWTQILLKLSEIDRNTYAKVVFHPVHHIHTVIIMSVLFHILINTHRVVNILRINQKGLCFFWVF